MADSEPAIGRKPQGRLAPSPTGLLHLGNAQAFLLAWLQMRSIGGDIILRIEDVDEGRAVANADREIQRDLRWLGLDWDNRLTEEFYQSSRRARYAELIENLVERGRAYPCYCSRREVREAMSAPHGRPGIYPGTCRNLPKSNRVAREEDRDPAWRVRTERNDRVSFVDLLVGRQECAVAESVGDFIVGRSDGYAAYHLAVVADDIDQGVTHVLRGEDLLDATPAQVFLYELFESQPPFYTHIPLVYTGDGKRLSKRTGARPLAEFRELGVDPRWIVGSIAAATGMIEQPRAVSPEELIDAFDLERIGAHRARVGELIGSVESKLN